MGLHVLSKPHAMLLADRKNAADEFSREADRLAAESERYRDAARRVVSEAVSAVVAEVPEAKGHERVLVKTGADGAPEALEWPDESSPPAKEPTP